jgi:hypothetical protein
MATTTTTTRDVNTHIAMPNAHQHYCWLDAPGPHGIRAIKTQDTICAKCRQSIVGTCCPPAPPPMRCELCAQVYYCCRPCQRIHWPVHQPQCTPFVTDKKTAPHDTDLDDDDLNIIDDLQSRTENAIQCNLFSLGVEMGLFTTLIEADGGLTAAEFATESTMDSVYSTQWLLSMHANKTLIRDETTYTFSVPAHIAKVYSYIHIRIHLHLSASIRTHPLPVCLSACLPVRLSVCLSACLSIGLSVCLSVCLSVSLSVNRFRGMY